MSITDISYKIKSTNKCKKNTFINHINIIPISHSTDWTQRLVIKLIYRTDEHTHITRISGHKLWYNATTRSALRNRIKPDIQYTKYVNSH